MGFNVAMATYLKIVIAALALLTARAHAGDVPHALTTTAMVGDLVKAVAGDDVRVTVLIGEGVDPHLFKPTRDDTAKLLKSDIVFYNGLMLEGKMADALIRLARRIPVVAVSESIDSERVLLEDGEEGYSDPHVWMDPTLWAQALDVVARELTALAPEHADDFESRAAAYAAQLEEMHAYSQRVLSSVPQDARVLITAHDAFGYFANQYGWRVEGIQGISTESEAGVRDIERLVEMLVENKIGAVFVETTVADRNIRALIDGAAARGHEVVIGGRLFSDAMGTPGTYEGTYLGMVDHNVTTIARALGGEAPQNGKNAALSGMDR